MNNRAVKALIKKDISAITSSAQMLLPMLIVPLMFVVVLPAVCLILGRAVNFESSQGNLRIITQFLNGIPDGAVKAQISAFATMNQKISYLMVNYLFAPLFLMVPTMVSSVVAANSFVGEKEKKTLETLLFSPVGETRLFFAKVLSAFLPAMAVTLVGYAVFCLEFALLGAPLFGHVVLPPAFWLAVVLWLAPAISLLVVFLNVLVSVKVKGYQEAQQMSVVVILPLLFLVYGQIGGVVFLSLPLVLGCGAVILAVDAALIRLAAKTYNRDKLFATQVF